MGEETENDKGMGRGGKEGRNKKNESRKERGAGGGREERENGMIGQIPLQLCFVKCLYNKQKVGPSEPP